MSRVDPRSMPEPACWDCGATNDPGASECWLCHRRGWRAAEASVPAKSDVSRGGGHPGLPITIAIVAGAILILGVGMILNIWERSDLWGLALLIPTLVIPVGLSIWARARKRPPSGQSMTNRELAAAGATIAAGVILMAWLVPVVGSIHIVTVIFGTLAIPAGLITAVRARRRSHQGRPMTGLQLTASVIFLAVLLPAMILTSLVVAILLICMVNAPSSFR
jgi:ribosomal protein L40E